jgi:hypothetical protein
MYTVCVMVFSIRQWRATFRSLFSTGSGSCVYVENAHRGDVVERRRPRETHMGDVQRNRSKADETLQLDQFRNGIHEQSKKTNIDNGRVDEEVSVSALAVRSWPSRWGDVCGVGVEFQRSDGVFRTGK